MSITGFYHIDKFYILIEYEKILLYKSKHPNGTTYFKNPNIKKPPF
jgi:hypothetical protein